MKLLFKKMHLLNNDFVVINGIQQNFYPRAELIRRWANRRSGIGFDQLLIVETIQHKKAHFQYRIFNANGNEVAQCGNGSLCVAQFLTEEKMASSNPIQLATHTGLIEVQFDKNSVTANLGVPIFDPPIIPFVSDIGQQGPFFSLNTPFGYFEACILSLGNPHCIIQTQKDIKDSALNSLGEYLNQSPHLYFPQGVNLEFMRIESPEQIDVRVYERGVGETHACGSGACAAMIAGRLLNKLHAKVKVKLPGGALQVHWRGHNTPVLLTGRGETVFKGEVEY